MKKLFLSMVAMLPILATAQNLLGEEANSFEPINGKIGGKIWIQPNDRQHVMVSDEKAADGKYSLKFSCQDFGTSKDIKATTSNPPLKLDAGKYEISLKVFGTEKMPKGFNIGLVEIEGGAFQQLGWKLKGAVPGQWTTLTQTKTLKSIEGAKIVISVSANEKWGGPGTFYIDDMKIVKVQ